LHFATLFFFINTILFSIFEV